MATATLDTTATTPKPARTRKHRTAVPTTFRLLLAIGGTVYWVRPVTSDLHSRAFRLRRADGKGEYHVIQDDAGHHCDCGDAVWRPRGRRQFVQARAGPPGGPDARRDDLSNAPGVRRRRRARPLQT